MSQQDQNEQQMPFTSLGAIRSALNEFFRFRESKILMLKGPWGVGKSYFLREYISANAPSPTKESILPDWVAYVSLFGCTSTQQLEERIAASIQTSNSWNCPSASQATQFFKELASSAKFSLGGVSFNLPVHSLIWRLTKQKDILLILDDLERAGENLKLYDILGFVSSLGENSKGGVKIIVVCNTGRLTGDAADGLAGLREKVIHTELLFNPSPDELVEQYFHHCSQKETMARCLRVIGEGNIRIIDRTSKAVTAITRLLEIHGIRLSEDEKKNIVRFCVFFFRVGRTVPIDWYRNSFLDDIMAGNETERESDPRRELFRKLEVDWDDVGPVIHDWLSYGLVADSVLNLAVASLNSKQWREAYRAKSSEAYKPWNSNFLTADPHQIAQPVADLVEEYCEVLPIDDLNSHLRFLEQLGIESTPWMLRHVQAWLPKMDFQLCETYLQRLPEGNARRLVEGHRMRLSRQRSPKEIIWNAIENQSFATDDMEYLASLDVSEIETWLRAESDRDTLSVLREFMRWVNPRDTTATSRAGLLISNAIRRIAADNPIHQRRAETFRLLLPDAR